MTSPQLGLLPAVADQLSVKLPKLATLMDDAENDVLAFMTFPPAHCRSTRPLLWIG